VQVPSSQLFNAAQRPREFDEQEARDPRLVQNLERREVDACTPQPRSPNFHRQVHDELATHRHGHETSKSQWSLADSSYYLSC